MGVLRSSRYLRQDKIQITDDKGGVNLAYEQRDTTVFEEDRPRGTKQIIPRPGSTLYDIARERFGNHRLWWVVADMNPEVFYPLDFSDGTPVVVPPREAVARFRRKQKG